jgi:type IV pilus assembly protein PilQ
MNLGGYILNDRFNLTLQLQAAESNGEGKVISSPRVVTLDNTEAKIEQGVSIPYQTFENGNAQLTFIDALLSLLVTPHITADKSIIMKIKVTRNAPDASVPTPTGSPAIAKNEAKTETLVKDGQTLVLGGIYVIERTETSQRVPFLYRIPILGNAFKNNAVKDNRKELLIFVTPRIVQTETAQN